MLKVVIDANVWISALLNPGKSRIIRSAFEQHRFVYYCSREMIVDIHSALSKPKLLARISPQDAADLLTLIEELAILVDLGQYPAISRDPKDDIYLACAVLTSSDCIVTGDDDLLCLKEYRNTKIITPAQFLEILNAANK